MTAQEAAAEAADALSVRLPAESRALVNHCAGWLIHALSELAEVANGGDQDLETLAELFDAIASALPLPDGAGG